MHSPSSAEYEDAEIPKIHLSVEDNPGPDQQKNTQIEWLVWQIIKDISSFCLKWQSDQVKGFPMNSTHHTSLLRHISILHVPNFLFCFFFLTLHHQQKYHQLIITAIINSLFHLFVFLFFIFIKITIFNPMLFLTAMMLTLK